MLRNYRRASGHIKGGNAGATDTLPGDTGMGVVSNACFIGHNAHHFPPRRSHLRERAWSMTFSVLCYKPPPPVGKQALCCVLLMHWGTIKVILPGTLSPLYRKSVSVCVTQMSFCSLYIISTSLSKTCRIYSF